VGQYAGRITVAKSGAMKKKDLRRCIPNGQSLKPLNCPKMSAKSKTEIWDVDRARAYFAKRKPYQPKKAGKGSGDKAKAEMRLMLQLIGLPFRKEFVFHPERKWRFDYCIESLKVAIEYEGIFSNKSRHTTISGFVGDCEKYREAAKLGWQVLRYTNKDYTRMSEDINDIIKSKAA
jgi:hypothetical protein